MRFLTVLPALALCAACSSEPVRSVEVEKPATSGKDDFLSVSFKGAAFTGKAGKGWSDADLKGNQFGAVCRANTKVASIAIDRKADGSSSFSGVCTG